MGNSWRQLRSSSMVSRSGTRSRCGFARLQLLPDKVAQRQERQPRRTRLQGYPEIRNPPGGNQYAQQRQNPQRAAPDPERRNLYNRPVLFRHPQTKRDVRRQRHQPDKRPAKKSHADQKHKRRFLEHLRKHQRHHQPHARSQHRRHRHATPAQFPEQLWREPAARKRKQHPRGEIQIAQRAGKRRGQHYEIHDMARRRNAHALKYPHERALSQSDFRPRHDPHHDRQPAQIKYRQPSQRPPQRARHRRFRIRGFARRHSDDFQSQKTENRHHHSQTNPAPSVRKKSSVRRVVRRADPRKPDAKQQHRPQHQKRQNRHHLDHREPILDRPEIFDAQRVNQHQRNGKARNPHPGRRLRQPELAIDGSRHHFAAHNHHQA